jgi:hypothetical protein
LRNGKSRHNSSYRRRSPHFWDEITHHGETDAANDPTEKSGRGTGEHQRFVCRSESAEIKKNMELWVGCVAGALSEEDYIEKLSKVGFDRIQIEPTRVYDIEDARSFLIGHGIDVDATAPKVQGKFRSAFIRATKPRAVQAYGE